ncbi:hypothetical protein [Arenimonas composti]|uniref:Secreted protein n=1 Tax=Arenimonas composti TR7-09 = DSM 18010 TaxID=1121013 RepID=A0A091C0M2_9GAMM|nr:hypothetical protein [Arenimonas composti]KFN50180.1 hypothetical protein P873_08045 [Arenimonas composti TR7-09 = DSM 18010]
MTTLRFAAVAAAFAATLVACATTTSVSAPADYGARALADGDPVSCRLPPQVRRLHGNVSILAAGRVVRTTAGDCRQRGGEARAIAAAAGPRDGSNGASAVVPGDVGGAVAVLVGGDGSGSACALAGTVAGLRTGQLNVRNGPGTRHPRQDGLGNGRRVFVCDGSADEQWLGIVYPVSGGQDCGLASARGDGGPYRGPCRAGWVNAGWISLDDD